MSSSTPVVVRARRLVAGNSKWNVFHDHVRDVASGAEIPDWVVLEPKVRQGDLISGVTVLPVVGDAILLIRNYRHPVQRHGWEAVRGFIDSGETPAEAAVRELAEEAALRCPAENLISLGFAQPEPSTLSARSALFAAPGHSSHTERDGEELGLGEVRSFSIAEAAGMMRRFEIEDCLTSLALHRYLTIRGAW
ncbi:MAG: NUDIX hydrolase [Rhodospirillales bacterium]|nr:NUDIX hydrolase [Rhodospirillales bacterium]